MSYEGFCPPPRGNFVDYFIHKVYFLTGFLKHVSLLAAGAFVCYSVLNTVPLIFLKKQKYIIKAVKVVLEQFKLAK